MPTGMGLLFNFCWQAAPKRCVQRFCVTAAGAQEWNTPYFTEKHRKFRAAMREFVDREIMPNCFEWDEAKRVRRAYRGVVWLVLLLPNSVFRVPRRPR